MRTTSESRPDKPWRSPAAMAVIVAAILALVATLVFQRLYVFADDDAYIHFRIARHLLTYGQPYFNPAEALMTSSAPLWTLLLAAVFATAGESLAAIALINALLTAAAAALWGLIARRLQPGSGALTQIYLSFLAAALLFPSGAGLMETPLALLLTALGVLTLLQRRSSAFVWLTLAAGCRPELIVTLPLALLLLGREGPKLYKSLLAITLSALPLALYCWYFFGTLLPQAVRAKSLVYQLSLAEFSQGLLWQIFAGFESWSIKWAGVSFTLILMALLLLLLWQFNEGKQVAKGESLPRRVRLLVLIVGLAILGAYTVSRAPLFPWYLPLFLVPLATIAVAAGLTRSGWVAKALALWLSLPFMVLLGQTLRSAVGPDLSPAFAPGARARSYLSLGQKLQQQCPQCSLLTPEIGALGFVFTGAIDDACGLASAAALRHHPLPIPEMRANGSIGAVPPALAAELNPDIIVAPERFVAGFAFSPMAQEYERRELPIFRPADQLRLGTDQLWGNQKILLFLKKASPAAQAITPE